MFRAVDCARGSRLTRPTGSAGSWLSSPAPASSHTIPTIEGQTGAVYAIGDVIVGLDVFNAASTYRRLARKLTASYALDATESSHVPAPPDLGAVRAFIDRLASAPRQRFITVGIGETVRLSGDIVVGAALEVDGRCVHLSAFRRVSAWQQDSQYGLNNTRVQRSSVRAHRG